jgi:thiosulfate/3-mercaptopyruvate sulfurtransferase
VDDTRAKTLITVEELTRLLDANTPVVLLDVLDEAGAAPDDRAKIPGALSVNLAADFSGKPTALSGRRPLPDIKDLQAKARAWGIRGDSAVVVRILDGGYAAWATAGRPSSNHVATQAAQAGDVALTPGHMPTIEADEAAALAKQGKLFDARPRSSYEGDPAKAGTGHIPGAIHAASGDNIADKKFKSADDLRARFASLGADGSGKVAVYCGSGNSAAHAIAAMTAAGLKPALYVGSWSAWSADPSRPAATGPERG